VLTTLLIKAKVRITAFSALGFFLLLLQILVFLAAAGALGLLAAGAGFTVLQQRRAVAA